MNYEERIKKAVEEINRVQEEFGVVVLAELRDLPHVQGGFHPVVVVKVNPETLKTLMERETQEQ